MAQIKGFYTDTEKRIRPITKRQPYIRPIYSGTTNLHIPKRTENKVRFTLARARYIHSQRSPRAQVIDEALEAKEVEPGPEWERYMNRRDIRGVDYFPVPLSDKLADNFHINNQIIKKEYEDHFNVTLKDLKWIRKGTALGKGYKLGKAAYAQYRPDEHALVFGRDCGRILKKGKIETKSDAYAIHALAHEMGHAVRGREGFMGYSKGSPISIVEEGSNEISSTRFVLNNIQMPKKLRKELLENPEYMIAYGYRGYANQVADMALLANNGDEFKAIQWIDGLRIAKNQRKYIEDAELDYYPCFDSRLQEQLKAKGIKPTKDRTGQGKESSYWYIVI